MDKLSEPYVWWMVVSVPLWVVTAMSVQILSMPPFWAYATGSVVTTLFIPPLGWFVDWREAQQGVNGFDS